MPILGTRTRRRMRVAPLRLAPGVTVGPSGVDVNGNSKMWNGYGNPVSFGWSVCPLRHLGAGRPMATRPQRRSHKRRWVTWTAPASPEWPTLSWSPHARNGARHAAGLGVSRPADSSVSVTALPGLLLETAGDRWGVLEPQLSRIPPSGYRCQATAAPRMRQWDKVPMAPGRVRRPRLVGAQAGLSAGLGDFAGLPPPGPGLGPRPR